ncbi:MAG: hypothetical protein KA952_01485 [Sediminibacterium sp.]|nr:hypothetical protein [Sediminibacterium sp.]
MYTIKKLNDNLKHYLLGIIVLIFSFSSCKKEMNTENLDSLKIVEEKMLNDNSVSNLIQRSDSIIFKMIYQFKIYSLAKERRVLVADYIYRNNIGNLENYLYNINIPVNSFREINGNIIDLKMTIKSLYIRYNLFKFEKHQVELLFEKLYHVNNLKKLKLQNIKSNNYNAAFVDNCYNDLREDITVCDNRAAQRGTIATLSMFLNPLGGAAAVAYVFWDHSDCVDDAHRTYSRCKRDAKQ